MPIDEDLIAPSRSWDDVLDDVTNRSARMRVRRRRRWAAISGGATALAALALVPVIRHTSEQRVATTSPAGRGTAIENPPEPTTQTKGQRTPGIILNTTTSKPVPTTRPGTPVSGATRIAAVQVDPSSHDATIVLMDPDHPGAVQPFIEHAVDPAWSPDGTQLAFTSMTGSHIYVRALSGGPAKDLGPGSRPAWSPDGTRIAFVDSPHGVSTIWTMRADGSERRVVAAPKNGPQNPSWAGPKLLLYEVTRDSANDAAGRPPEEIHLISSDGNGDRVVAFGSEPAGSPDGRSLAYVGKNGIVVANIDGTGSHAITSPFDTGDSSPAWSPNGAFIAFARSGEGSRSVYTINAKGGPTTLIADNAMEPAWGVVPK